MTNYQEGLDKMSSSSELFLLENASITSRLPGFNGYFNTIQSVNKQLRVVVVQQEADKSGETTTKRDLRTVLISQAIDVSRRVIAYSTNVNNEGLKALVNYTESELKKSSDQKLVSSCQLIHDNANVYLVELEEYGITSRMINVLQDSITSYNEMIPKSRLDTTNSGDATQMIASLFKILKTNWKKIDTLVTMLRVSDPNFYNEYFKVRKVIVKGNGSLALKIKVINSDTGLPEVNVTLTVIPINGLSKTLTANGKNKGAIVKKSAKGGGSHYKSLPDGTYTVTATKPGFKIYSETINVINGELTVLEIEIEKAS